MEMQLAILRIVRLFVLLIPCTLLIYHPFIKQLRVSKLKIILGMILLTVVSVLGVLCSKNLSPQSQYWQILCVCLYFVFYILTVNVPLNRSAFIFFAVLCYGCLITGFAACTADFLFSAKLINSIVCTVLLVIFGACSYPIVYRQFKRKVTFNINHAPAKSIRHLYILPLIYCASHVYYEWIYHQNNTFGISTYYSILLVRAVSIGFFVALVFNALDVAVEHDTLQQRMTSAEQVLASQASQFGNLKSYIETVRQTRHDMRHHIRVVRQFIETNDKVGLSAYIEDYSEGLPPAVVLNYCDNKPANFLLFYYSEKATASNILFTIRADATEKGCITDAAISILLGNCFENAFEACERMTEGERFIRANLQITETDFIMTVDNSFNGEFEKRGDAFISSKRADRIGVGTSSIVALVEKYDGHVSFAVKDNVFMVSVRIKDNSKAKISDSDIKLSNHYIK